MRKKIKKPVEIPAVNLQRMVSQPVRIQLSRKRGWKMPPNTVKVDRTTKWGNHWARPYHTNAEAVARFKEGIEETTFPEEGLSYAQKAAKDLRAKNLACWCKLYDKKGLRVPCHADILLSLANDIPLEKICEPLTTRSSQSENATPASR